MVKNPKDQQTDLWYFGMRWSSLVFFGGLHKPLYIHFLEARTKRKWLKISTTVPLHIYLHEPSKINQMKVNIAYSMLWVWSLNYPKRIQWIHAKKKAPRGNFKVQSGVSGGKPTPGRHQLLWFVIQHQPYPSQKSNLPHEPVASNK